MSIISLKATKTILWTLLYTSVMMLLLNNHPLVMGGMLIIQAILIAFLLTKTFLLSLFSYFMFMIYLGGILMLFSYVISITYSQEPLMKTKKKNIIFMIIVFFLLSSFGTTMEFSQAETSKMIMSCYSQSSSFMVTLMGVLLLLMVMVVFITETSKGSMRAN